jgi:hypothetical protein
VEDETPCDAVNHRYYRTQVGRLPYYGALRAEMQFAIKELARDVQAPTQASLNALKRCSPQACQPTLARLAYQSQTTARET